jgi:hypothetical protein
MRHQGIKVGYRTFVDNSDEAFGAVRAILSDDHLSVYVENTGEFLVEKAAVLSIGPEKVTFSHAKLDDRLRDAIKHAHDAEDPDL